jgi:hypothetical protein
MTTQDLIAALSTIRARVEVVGERLTMCRVPLGMIAELGLIMKAIEKLEEDAAAVN